MQKRYKLRIPVGELFNFFGLNKDTVDVKLNRYVAIKTPEGTFTPIRELVTKRGMVREYTLSNGNTIRCDEKHLVKTPDNTFAHINTTSEVDTTSGIHSIVNSTLLGEHRVYDFSLDAPHEYVTSMGVICHNTTAAKILVKNIDCDYMFINASDERGIDTVRDKIKGFASTVGFKPLKIVVLDECLEENTLVHVLRGGVQQTVPIREVDPNNDLVRSLNLKKNKVEWRPFEKLDKGIQDVYEIELANDEVVVCTATHKWYVNDGGETKVVKTSELHKYNHILSPE